MNWRTLLLPGLLVSGLALPAVLAAGGDKAPAAGPARTKVTWKKTVIDPVFRSEGVGVADVNKDGKPDIIIGDCWYEAPREAGGQWQRHVLRADRKYPLDQYTDSFCCF